LGCAPEPAKRGAIFAVFRGAEEDSPPRNVVSARAGGNEAVCVTELVGKGAIHACNSAAQEGPWVAPVEDVVGLMSARLSWPRNVGAAGAAGVGSQAGTLLDVAGARAKAAAAAATAAGSNRQLKSGLVPTCTPSASVCTPGLASSISEAHASPSGAQQIYRRVGEEDVRSWVWCT